MYMDVIKLFAHNEKELETLIQVVRIYSQDSGIEFGMEKCALLIMRGRKQVMERIELQNQEKIRRSEKGNIKVFGNIGSIKQAEMKEKILKKYLMRTGKLLENKLYSRNHIKEVKFHLTMETTQVSPL